MNGLPSFVTNAGNDGVERPLAGRVDVRVPGIEREQLAAILQHEAETVGTT